MKSILDQLADDPNLSPEFARAIKPSRVVPCFVCHGSGYVTMMYANRETERKCAYCRGLGRIATNSGEP